MQKEQALSLDIDGVVVGRPPIQLGALIKRHIKGKGETMYEPPTEIPRITRETVDGNLRPSEYLSYAFHWLRMIKPESKRYIESRTDVDIYGNTGRLNRRPWVNMTDEMLRIGGVRERFIDVFFKPEGTKGMHSKLAAIADLRERYGPGNVTHFDDNPADALPIARFFPDVQVVIVQDLSTGLLYSKSEAQAYPNVRRVANLKRAEQV